MEEGWNPWSPKTVWVGRDHKDRLVPTLLPRAGCAGQDPLGFTGLTPAEPGAATPGRQHPARLGWKGESQLQTLQEAAFSHPYTTRGSAELPRLARSQRGAGREEIAADRDIQVSGGGLGLNPPAAEPGASQRDEQQHSNSCTNRISHAWHHLC